MRQTISWISVMIALALSACAPSTTNQQIAQTPTGLILPSDTPGADIPITQAPQPTVPTQSVEILPPDPIRVEFTTEDDVPLIGYYYSAAQSPAPVIVLMHWAQGDQTDWVNVGMVSWLQNRGVPFADNQDNPNFDTPFTFTPLPAEVSYAVFTFDFRGYGESGFSGEGSKHILDAKAAYKAAALQPGVDPSKIIGIGASIGADAVVDGCESCAGAISLSPGDYLNTPYAEAMSVLTQRGIPVMCVAAENDLTSFYKCKDLEETGFSKQIYPEGGHAMKLFRESVELDPAIDILITNFLIATLD